MSRPHAAAIVEDAWNERVTAVLRHRGWKARIVSYTGYGSTSFVRVLARVLMSRQPHRLAAADASASSRELSAAEDEQRGWRAFITAPAMNAAVTVTVNGRQTQTRSDRSGLVDLRVWGHGLPPGWHEVTIASPEADDVGASVLIVGPEQTLGLVSDIDDTVITTSLPRPMIAAWNTFVRQQAARRPVPGMASMYRELLDAHPGAPIVYVSTGAWNTAPTLTRFLKRNGYPLGPLLLTDWGPTNTGWFRSGQAHKSACLHRLAEELPGVRWLLVGDDGQHDPKIYGDFADQRPKSVAAVAIRELSPTEQVLSHGIPVAIDEFPQRPRRGGEVPVCRAADGYGLLRSVRVALGQAA